MLVGSFAILIKTILLPFLFAFILAYLLNPFVSYFEAKGIRRVIVVIALYICAIIIIFGLGQFIVPEIMDEITRFKNNAGFYLTQTKAYIATLKAYLLRLPIFANQTSANFIEQEIFPKAIEGFSSFASNLPKKLFSAISVISLFFLVPFISFFTLIRGHKAIDAVFNVIPPKYVETVLGLICEIDALLGRYLRGVVLDATCVAILATIGLTVLGVEQALILGPLVGLGNLIPYIGSVIGGIPAVVIVFLKTKSLIAVLKVIGMFMFVQFLDNNFIAPFVVGNTVKLHPVAILFALLVGAHFFGPLGMVLAVPTFCIFKIIATTLLRYSFKTEPPSYNKECDQIIL